MDVVALVLWVVTAIGGLTMAGSWLVGGGPAEHRAGIGRLSLTRVGAHFGLAATGLVLWIMHLALDNNAPGWVALALLPLAAAVGFLMFTTWIAGRAAESTPERSAEQRIPVAVVAAHGAFAVATVIAVFIALLV